MDLAPPDKVGKREAEDAIETEVVSAKKQKVEENVAEIKINTKAEQCIEVLASGADVHVVSMQEDKSNDLEEDIGAAEKKPAVDNVDITKEAPPGPTEKDPVVDETNEELDLGDETSSSDDDDDPQTPVTPTEQTSGGKTLYVGNLSFSVWQEDVDHFFKAAGEVVNIRFAMNSDETFKGYGYVEFASAEAAEKALLELNGKELLCRRVRLDFVKERGSLSRYTSCREAESFQKGGKAQGRTVFVRGFSKSDCQDEVMKSLEEHFSSCGEVSRVSVPKDQDGCVRGIAYIDFKDRDAFDRALALNGSAFREGILSVIKAKPKGDRHDSAGSGRYYGRNGGHDFGGRSGWQDFRVRSSICETGAWSGAGVQGESNERGASSDSNGRGVWHGSSERGVWGGSSKRGVWGHSNGKSASHDSSGRGDWGDSNGRGASRDSSCRGDLGASSGRGASRDSSCRSDWGHSSGRGYWGTSSGRGIRGDSNGRGVWGESMERGASRDSGGRCDWGVYSGRGASRHSSGSSAWRASSGSGDWGASWGRGDRGNSSGRGAWRDSSGSGAWCGSSGSGDWGAFTGNGDRGNSSGSGAWGASTGSGDRGNSSGRGAWRDSTGSGDWGASNGRGVWGDSSRRGVWRDYSGRGILDRYSGSNNVGGTGVWFGGGGRGQGTLTPEAGNNNTNIQK